MNSSENLSHIDASLSNSSQISNIVNHSSHSPPDLTTPETLDPVQAPGQDPLTTEPEEVNLEEEESTSSVVEPTTVANFSDLPRNSNTERNHYSLRRRRDSLDIIQNERANKMAARSSMRIGSHLDCPQELRSVLSNMISDPQIGELCDVTIIVEGERFRAHRAVLAASSGVFRAMFTNGMREQKAQEVELKELRKDAWKLVMHFIYNATVDLEGEPQALTVLEAARMYQLETLEKFAESFLIRNVRLTNVFELLSSAEKYSLVELEEACYTAIEDDFETVSASSAFLQSPSRIVFRLVESDQLKVRTEMNVLQSVIRWLESDEKSRRTHAWDLFRRIRLDRLTDMQVREVGRQRICMACEKFKSAILERLVYGSGDEVEIERRLAFGCGIKARRRGSSGFHFVRIQRGISKVSSDDEEVMRSQWAVDFDGKYMWRLKIYPRGYSKAKGQFLSMYLQARPVSKTDILDITAKFDIFLVNQQDNTLSEMFSSQHHFNEGSDHWGFHRFLQLSRLLSPSIGYLDVKTDSIVVGANVYIDCKTAGNA